MIRWFAILLFAAMALPAMADDSKSQVYTESFRKGATRITEQKFDVTLTTQYPTREFKIRDSNGTQRYTLQFVPDVPRGDTKVVGWFVRLEDLQHKIYESVLPTSQDVARDTTEAWWLDGRRFAKIPLNAARVFKVEQFYCVVQVKDSKRLAIGQDHLQQLDLLVEFTNTKPQ